ncbi:MAG: HEAT repeat domain-containing protein [Polyangiaceae bacterium]|nr:HEAT repeat domain-containing protein [Polyangiaceae bacterium]
MQTRWSFLLVLSAIGCASSPTASTEQTQPALVTATVTAEPVASTSSSADVGAKPVAPNMMRTSAFGCPLAISLEADKRQFTAGEPVFLSFTVSTTCERTVNVIDGGDYRNRFGRPESYNLSALGNDGSIIDPIDVGPQFGGLMGPRAVKPTEPFVKRLLVAHWLTFDKPGRYTIRVEKTLSIGQPADRDMKALQEVPAKLAIDVDVLPASNVALGAVIYELGARLLETGERAEEAERALSMVQDERVVAHYVKAMKQAKPGSSFGHSAIWVLKAFATDEAFKALEDALSDSSLHLAAAQAISESKHPKAFEKLWSLRHDKDPNVRLTVVHELGKRDDADSTKKLNLMLQDVDALVHQEAQRYLSERKKKGPSRNPR